MIYITVKQSPRYHQMSLEEFFFSDQSPALISNAQACTRTYAVERPSQRVLSRYNINDLVQKLEQFNHMTEGLFAIDRHTLYRTFQIPKKTRGYRQIDAPNDVLKGFQSALKTLIETEFISNMQNGAFYHTSAFAYVKKRRPLDAVKRHQENESRWYAKYDFSNFFGSTTKEFVMHMFSMVMPFSEIMKTQRGMDALSKALDIAFLDGVLPQGTPISPMITNIMMIPIDHTLSNKFRDFDKHQFIYTRYADDIFVSSQYDFDFRKIDAEINSVLKSFDAPFQLKEEKTRYGSTAGANWMLGVVVNKDNKITVGAKKKREFKGMLSNYVLDTLHGIPWEKEDVMALEGFRNYYASVERETIDEIVKNIGEKYNVNVVGMLKASLRA